MTKTPEQMQKEAEHEGQMRSESWFGLGHPWFRLHFISVLNRTDILNVGLSPLGCDLVSTCPSMISWITDAINEVTASSIAMAYLVGWAMADMTTLAGTLLGPFWFAGAFVISILAKYGMLMLSWDSAERLKGSFIGACFSLAYGFITALAKIVALGITALIDISKLSGLNFWGLIFKFLYVPVNMYFLMKIILRVTELGGWQ